MTSHGAKKPTDDETRGVFDISLIASIASHLSYWADEDVSHFMISQLLSRHRILETGQEIKERWNDVKLKHV